MKHAPVLPPPVPGERIDVPGPAGRLAFWCAGNGPPLLLIHSINAAGSAYEVRPVFEAMAGTRRVIAVELPGFGASDRSPGDYSIRRYVDAVHAAREFVVRTCGPAPFDALALSLSAEFLARAATEASGAFRTLTLVTPTGFSRGASRRRGPPGASREIRGLHAVLAGGPWGAALYRGLTVPASIRYFLRRTWGSDAIDAGLAEYDVLATRQPGAEHAPFAFLSGRLFAADVAAVYERLTLPVWVPHGTRGDFKDFSDTAWAEATGRWRFTPYPTGALPFFERPADFLRDFRAFLDAPHAAAAGPAGGTPR